jgi:hypothetical protein
MKGMIARARPVVDSQYQLPLLIHGRAQREALSGRGTDQDNTLDARVEPGGILHAGGTAEPVQATLGNVQSLNV